MPTNPTLPEPLQTWPERIYLQHGSDELPPFNECHDITWCADGIEPNDIRYVRADVSAKRIAELEGALMEAARTLGQIRNLTTAPRLSSEEYARLSARMKIWDEHDEIVCQIAHMAATEAFEFLGDQESARCSLQGGNFLRDHAAMVYRFSWRLLVHGWHVKLDDQILQGQESKPITHPTR